MSATDDTPTTFFKDPKPYAERYCRCWLCAHPNAVELGAIRTLLANIDAVYYNDERVMSDSFKHLKRVACVVDGYTVPSRNLNFSNPITSMVRLSEALVRGHVHNFGHPSHAPATVLHRKDRIE